MSPYSYHQMRRMVQIHPVHLDYLSRHALLHLFPGFLLEALVDRSALTLYCSSENTFLIWPEYVYRTCISLMYYSAAESESIEKQFNDVLFIKLSIVVYLRQLFFWINVNNCRKIIYYVSNQVDETLKMNIQL